MNKSHLRKYLSLSYLNDLRQKKEYLPNGEASFSKEDIDKLNSLRKILIESYLFNLKQNYGLLISSYLSETISITEFKLFFLQAWLIDHEDAQEFDKEFSFQGIDMTERYDFELNVLTTRGIKAFIVPTHPKVSSFYSQLQFIADLCYAIDQNSYRYTYSCNSTDGPEARKVEPSYQKDNERFWNSLTDKAFQSYIQYTFQDLEFDIEDNVSSEKRPTTFRNL